MYIHNFVCLFGPIYAQALEKVMVHNDKNHKKNMQKCYANFIKNFCRFLEIVPKCKPKKNGTRIDGSYYVLTLDRYLQGI